MLQLRLRNWENWFTTKNWLLKSTGQRWLPTVYGETSLLWRPQSQVRKIVFGLLGWGGSATRVRKVCMPSKFETMCLSRIQTTVPVSRWMVKQNFANLGRTRNVHFCSHRWPYFDLQKRATSSNLVRCLRVIETRRREQSLGFTIKTMFLTA